MRLPAPRVIAIDDEPKHLEGLAQGLNRYGAACLPVHFTGEADIPPCSHVRVIFADLHLGGGSPGDHMQDFSVIGGLIEDTIQPSGPYFIVLWTMYPEEAENLYKFLVGRLGNVAKPFTVQALNKADHLDPKGNIKNPGKLIQAIEQIVAEQPQIGALLNWEERVLGAAGDTVSSIVELADSSAEDADLSDDVRRLLVNLAIGAVGEEHVKENRFRAVNDALLPILADRIASMRSRNEDADLWRTALGALKADGLVPDKTAKLNRLLHIAPSTADDDPGERGTVIALPDKFLGDAFAKTFDLTSKEAMKKQFRRCKQLEDDDDTVRWVLVQTQAACDYAQNQPGPLPFHLGLCLPKSKAQSGTPPAALWISPSFQYCDRATRLHVNARFQLSMSKEKVQVASPLFRLREQLLNDLIYKLHGYGARPGIISFR